MKRRPIEPGLLPLLRLMAVLQLVLTVLIALAIQFAHRVAPHPIGAPLLMLGISIVLVAYLCVPHLEDRLGGAYLPLALGLVVATPYAGQWMVLLARPDSAVYVEYVKEQIAFLVFPLLLVSWQYRFRWVAVFTLGLCSIDVLMLASVYAPIGAVGPDFPRTMFARTIAFFAVGYVITHLVHGQRRQRVALQRANAQLAHYAATLEQLATSRERNRLARELHDTLAHTLSGMAVELEAAKTLWDTDPTRARALVERSLTATRDGLTETRRALHALRAAPLEDLGLILALRALAESIAAQTGAALDWHAPERAENLPSPVEQCVYRVAQEALENIARHASAKRIGVKLARDDNRLTLQISDNGKGFVVDKVDVEKHLGLKGMCERAEMLGGSLQVESQPGRGTVICLRVGS
ncbi:MAG: sensor histidine kinase [Chloroflexota bacterium]